MWLKHISRHNQTIHYVHTIIKGSTMFQNLTIYQQHTVHTPKLFSCWAASEESVKKCTAIISSPLLRLIIFFSQQKERLRQKEASMSATWGTEERRVTSNFRVVFRTVDLSCSCPYVHERLAVILKQTALYNLLPKSRITFIFLIQ